MKNGRPSKYNERTIPLTIDYIKNYEDFGDAFPSIEGLCMILGVGRSTIYDWENDPEKEDFSDTLEALRISSIRVLMNRGLKNEINPMITKLALGNYGITEKSQTDLISSDQSFVPNIIELVPAPFPENFLEDAEAK